MKKKNYYYESQMEEESDVIECNKSLKGQMAHYCRLDIQHCYFLYEIALMDVKK
jgi:hypothetical protein